MREKYLAFVLGMVLVSIIFFMLAGNSLKKNLADIGTYDKKIKEALQKQNSAITMDRQLEGFREIITNTLTTGKKFTPEELNSIYVEIDRLREQNQLKLIKMTPSNKFTEAGLVETTYTMELRGTFRDMGQFVSELEALNRIIKIQELAVSPSQATEKNKAESSSGENIYRINLELSVFKVIKEA